MDVTLSFIRREVPREVRREALQRILEAFEEGERGERREEEHEPGDAAKGGDAKPPMPPAKADLF